MNPWKLILATVVIFGAGVVMGGFLVKYAANPPAKTSHRTQPAAAASTNHAAPDHPIDLTKVRPPELLSLKFVQKLDDALQLTPAQREAIQKIITCGQEQNHSIWTNCNAQSRQVLQEVRQHIREQLNPDQKKEFEELLKQEHPAGRKAPGTNSAPVLPPATNSPAVLATNLAGM